jgi:hypothetical protein
MSQSHFDAGVLQERERCKEILRQMTAAAEARRKNHHAKPWLEHALEAIQVGADPYVKEASEASP